MEYPSIKNIEEKELEEYSSKKYKEYALQNRFSRIRLDVTAITTGQHEWTK